jgi:hypothetical protein
MDGPKAPYVSVKGERNVNANDPSLVPAHYQSAGGYIHWDLVIATDLGYLDGNCSKYVARWRKKGGLQDLQKALHYINKAIECDLSWPERIASTIGFNEVEADKFAEANQLSQLEQLIVAALVTWENEDDLIKVRDMILLLMEEAQPPEPKPVPVEDSSRHAERIADKTGW